MRVFITGVGGFVGGGIARAFLRDGWEVTALCRNRRPGWLSAYPSMHTMTGDLRTFDALPGRYDYVVHCAAELPAYCTDSDELYRSNVEGTRRLLELASGCGTSKIAYMSSMSIYGTISRPVVDEMTIPGAPDVYGQSKAAGERMVADWARDNAGSAVSIRLPGTVGPGGRNNFLCNSLRRILADQAIDARNPEAMFNNIVHVDDLAGFVVSLYSRMPVGHNALTIAARDTMTIREVLSHLFRCAGREPRIVWAVDNGASFLISFRRACELGYRPATVADSIERFVADVLVESRYD